MTGAVGLGVFLVVVALIVIRPRGISEALVATLGALAVVGLGLLSPMDALAALSASVPLLLFFLGLMVISAIAEEAGFFDEMARWAVLQSHGSPRRLLVNMFLVGTAITALLTNDATALVLTPVVYVLVTRLKLAPTPFVFACTFVADAASFVLPISNPVNIILLSTADMRLDRYLLHLLPAATVAIGANLVAILWLFRGQLVGHVHHDLIPPPVGSVGYLQQTRLALGAIALGYVVATSVGIHVGIIAIVGGGLMAVVALTQRRLDGRRLVRTISWPLFPFIAGMVVLVQVVERVGVTTLVAEVFGGLASASPPVAIATVTFVVALAANLMNNIPAALVVAEALHSPGLAGETGVTLRYAAVLGADLGPNVSVTGSLATMLWLMMLRVRGLHISSLQYLRLGTVVTVPALTLGAFALWLSSAVMN